MRRKLVIGLAIVLAGAAGVAAGYLLAPRTATPDAEPTADPPKVVPDTPKPAPDAPKPPAVPPAEPPARTDQYGDPLPPGMLCRIGTVRFRGDYTIRVAFSRDGAAVLTADERGIRSWDTRTGRPLPPRPAVLSGANIAFTPHGDLFGDFWVWKLSEPGPRPFPVPSFGPYTARLSGVSPDGTRGVFETWNRSALWNLTTNTEVAELTARPPPNDDFRVPPTREPPYRRPSYQSSVEFSRDGRTLVVYTGTGLSVRRADTGEQTRFVPLACAECAFAISDDASLAATANDSKASAIDVWNLTTGERVVAIAVPSDRFLHHLRFSPDGTRLVALSDNRLFVWSPTDGRRLGYSEEFGWDSPRDIAFSPDSRTFAGAIQSGVCLHDATTAAPLLPVPGWGERFWRARLSADGRRVTTTRLQRLQPDGPRRAAGLRVWDADTGQLLSQPDEPFPFALGLSADGGVLAGWTKDGPPEIWDVATRTRRPPLVDSPKGQYVTELSPDGNWLDLQIMDGNTPRERRTWDTRTGQPVTPALAGKSGFYPDRFPHRVVTKEGVGTEIWDVPTGRRLLSIPEPKPSHRNFFWRNESEVFTVDEREKVWRHWSLASGQELPPIEFAEYFAKCPGHRFRGHIAFLPDGNRFAVIVGSTGTLWDFANKKLLKTWTGDDSYSWDFAVSRDGKRVIATGSYSVAVWDLDAIPDVGR